MVIDSLHWYVQHICDIFIRKSIYFAKKKTCLHLGGSCWMASLILAISSLLIISSAGDWTGSKIKSSISSNDNSYFPVSFRKKKSLFDRWLSGSKHSYCQFQPDFFLFFQTSKTSLTSLQLTPSGQVAQMYSDINAKNNAP